MIKRKKILLEIIPIVFSIILLHLTIITSNVNNLEKMCCLVAYIVLFSLLTESLYNVIKKKGLKLNIALLAFSLFGTILLFTTVIAKYRNNKSNAMYAVWTVSFIVCIISIAVSAKEKKKLQKS